jgi:hypothetical protein
MSVKSQTKMANGKTVSLNVNKQQVSGLENRGFSHEIIYIPSVSQPNFNGSYFVIDVKELQCKIHQMILQFDISSITGYTPTSGNTGYQAYFVPAFWFFSKIEFLMNGQIVDIYLPEMQFIITQFYQNNDQRMLENASSGVYTSTSSRATMASTRNYYYVNLKTLFNQAHIPLLTTNHYSQLKIYLNNTSNIINCDPTKTTGTPTCTINACNLILYVTKLNATEQALELAKITKQPMHYKYHKLLYTTYVLQSGITNQKNVLSFLVGKCSMLYFVVRQAGTLNGDGYFNFQSILSFDILSSGGTSILGGTQALTSFNLLEEGRNWTKSSYLSEYVYGTSNSFVYNWSWSPDPLHSYTTGADLGNYQFTGTEQLVIYFSSSTSVQYQLDAFALIEQALEVTPSTMTSITL